MIRMGFRFRKSIKIAPGISLNLGKKGISASIGPRGAKVTIGSRGSRATLGIPANKFQNLYVRSRQRQAS